MAKYRKKPVAIEAFKYGDDRPDWFDDQVSADIIRTYKTSPDEGPFVRGEGLYCIIRTLEGDMRANEGDYIIKGVQGEIYPCKPDIFEQTYDKID